MSEHTIERHAALLRAWHLAILRFALTRNNADRLGVLAIANEIDRLGRPHEVAAGFSFFRRESKELCAATLRQRKQSDVILNRYLAQIGDARLKRALAVALEVPPQAPGQARSRRRPNDELWRGLPARGNAQP
ncbi:MAG: hypothetical protein GY844_09800 [Bradyrhizobium sp.]|nr:hypothetical protein [Bradyrhizobium sp.]